MPNQNPDIKRRFKEHSATGDKPVRFSVLRDRARELGELIDEVVPEGREKSLALTKLEESVFWANAAIARE